MISIQQILLPTDFSASSEQAISYACEFAKRFKAQLHLLHVVQPIALPGYIGPLPQAILEPEEAAKKELDGWEPPSLEDAKSVFRVIRTGAPFVEIVRYAKEQNIDLIVMGTHGRSAFEQALMGSVAEKVVRKAACPVLTVHPEGHQFVMP